MARVLAVDVGRRRIGLAVSDRLRTLARPLAVVQVSGQVDAVRQVVDAADRLRAEEDGLETIVVGLPRALDGAATPETAHVTAFIDALKHRTEVPIVTEDERLTSREAESRLALHERDWKKRKARLDAEAAAIILQDYLDRRR